jgi:hypothetical protein
VRKCLFKKPIQGSHTNGELHPAWPDLGNPVGCGDIKESELHGSIFCFVAAPGKLLGEGGVGIERNGGSFLGLLLILAVDRVQFFGGAFSWMPCCEQ